MASNPQAFRHAAQKYGHLVDGVAARYGHNLTGAQLLLKVAKGESGFNMAAVSSAGARGGTQFMPATRADYVKRYGVDPWRNPDQAIKGTALYLRNSGTVASYNPGMPSYTNYILDQKVKPVRASRGHESAKSSRGHVTRGTPGKYNAGTAPTMTPGKTTQDISGALVDALLSGKQGRQGKSLLAATTALLDTGQYDKTTPTKINAGTKPSYTPGTKPSYTPAAHKVTDRRGVVSFEGQDVAAWIKPILAAARKAGVAFRLSSGYRSDADQKRIYDSGVRPAAVPRAYGGGGSNHEFKAFPGGAVDVGSGAADLAAWLAGSKYAKTLVYAGSKDPVHFSFPHGGHY